ncbi:MAG: hypothetical protein ACW99J_08505, partial [Candidatus Thorarchaeota archaeon]
EDESDDGLRNTLADVKDVREDLHKRYAEDFLSELEKQDEYEESLETERSEEDSVVNDAADYDRDTARDDRQEGNLPYDQYDEDERNEIRKSIEDTENELEKGVDESLPESEEDGKREDVEGPEGESKTESTVTWVESGDGTVTGVVTDTSEAQSSSSETSQEQEENAKATESTEETASTSEMETSGSSENREPDGSESRTRETEADASMEKSHERRDPQEGTDGHEDTRSESESTDENRRSPDEAASNGETDEKSEQKEDVASEHSESPSSAGSESHLDKVADDSEAGSSETTESGQTKRVERASAESGNETDSQENGHDTGTSEDERVKEIEWESAETSVAESERSAEQEARERSLVEQSLVEDEEGTEESASDEAIEKIKEILEEAEIEEERDLLPNEEVIGKEYKWWETEEDRLLEKLLEGLDEETRRRLKRMLEVKIETEEDLDELIDLFKDEYSEEDIERAREYLRFKKKQRELGIPEDLSEVDLNDVAEKTEVDTHDASFWVNDRERPALIRMLEELERERRMAFVWGYKSALRQSRSLAHESEYTVSHDHLQRYLKKLREESQTAVSKESIKEASDWFDVMQSLQKGEVRTSTRKGQKFVHEDDVKKLARRLRLPREKVTQWLKGDVVPEIISESAFNLTEARDVLSGIDQEVYRLYFEEHMSQKRIAKELGVTEWSVRKLFEKHAWKTRGTKHTTEQRGKSYRIEISRDLFEVLLSQNQSLRFMPTFDKRHHEVTSFYDLHDLLGEGDVDLYDFARRKNTPYDKISEWARGKSRPYLIESVHDLELRKMFERAHGHIPESKWRQTVREWARESGIDVFPVSAQYSQTADAESVVWLDLAQVLTPSERNNPNLDDFARLIEIAYNTLVENDARVLISKFGASDELTEIQISEIRRLFEAERKNLRRVIGERLGLDKNAIQFAFVDNRLYVWRPDRSVWNLLNPFEEQYFYFPDRERIADLLTEVCDALEGAGTSGLRRTVEHLETVLQSIYSEKTKPSLLNDEGRSYKVKGKHLHFLLDLTGKDQTSLEGSISRVTGRSGQGGIENPRFPIGEELQIALARFVATILCDGSRKAGEVRYWDSEMDRIMRVEKNLQSFGDIKINPKWEDGTYCCRITRTMGEILGYLGIPIGDKTMNNPELRVEFINGLSWKALCAFIEDILPEDGTVAPNVISCVHSVALHPGDMSEKYNLPVTISENEISLVKSKGTKEADHWRLQIGKLTKLKDSLDPVVSEISSSLIEKVMDNPSNLILGEKTVLDKLGVSTVTKPVSVFYFEKTGKVSVSWRWTAFYDDAMKLAMIAPPNDTKKQGILRQWLLGNLEDVRRLQKELSHSGTEFETWWE